MTPRSRRNACLPAKAWLDSKLLDDLAREMKKAIPEIESAIHRRCNRAAKVRADGRPLF